MDTFVFEAKFTIIFSKAAHKANTFSTVILKAVMFKLHYISILYTENRNFKNYECFFETVYKFRFISLLRLRALTLTENGDIG